MSRILAVTDRPSLRLALDHVLRRLGAEYEIVEGERFAELLPGQPDTQWVVDSALADAARRWPELPILWLVPPGGRAPEGPGLRWPEQLEELGPRLRKLIPLDGAISSAPEIERGEAYIRPLVVEPQEARLHRSALWARVETQIQRLAPHDIPILIRGESGTGKELVARGIHDASGRGDRPFVAVHCGAIPADLLESELFGHERGAFTDAHQRHVGRFEAAGDGTLFLDEIGEMPLALQSKLLRVLQEREIRRVGGSEEIAVRARVLAATHRDLRAMVEAGSFREDLLHRLLVGHLELPPLRERPEDLRLLTEFFLMRMARETGRELEGLDQAAWERLESHSWPGNVRELEHLLRRSLLLSRHELLGPDDLAFDQAESETGPLEALLRRRIEAGAQPEQVMAQLRGELESAAEKLGITSIRSPEPDEDV